MLENFNKHLHELLSMPRLSMGDVDVVKISVVQRYKTDEGNPDPKYLNYVPTLIIEVLDCPPIYCRTRGQVFHILESDNSYYYQHFGSHSVYKIMSIIEENIKDHKKRIRASKTEETTN